MSMSIRVQASSISRIDSVEKDKIIILFNKDQGARKRGCVRGIYVGSSATIIVDPEANGGDILIEL